MPSSFTTVLVNMVENVNKDTCVCWGARWNVGGVVVLELNSHFGACVLSGAGWCEGMDFRWIDQNWKANKYSFLTIIDLGPPVPKYSARITKFIFSPLSNTNFVKRKSKTDHLRESNCLLNAFLWDIIKMALSLELIETSFPWVLSNQISSMIFICFLLFL